VAAAAYGSGACLGGLGARACARARARARAGARADVAVVVALVPVLLAVVAVAHVVAVRAHLDEVRLAPARRHLGLVLRVVQLLEDRLVLDHDARRLARARAARQRHGGDRRLRLRRRRHLGRPGGSRRAPQRWGR
jgi:hypothetical protein